MIRRPGTILLLLTGLNLLNYLDRFVLSAVLPKVQDELHLSNVVGGALATIFLVGYFTTSPIFGLLSDRGGSRKGLIAVGIGLWSLATIGSGIATGAGTLVLARALVGVGEASYATIAPTIIDDIAPPEKRGRYLAVFYSAIPIGSALGYLVGGAVERALGWRSAFFVAGGPGILLALLALLIVEPARSAAGPKTSLIASVKSLTKIPLYRKGIFGYCAYQFALGGFAFWAPTFLFRRYGMELGHANFVFGTITVVAGALGTFAGGALGDRASRAPSRKAKSDAAPFRKNENTEHAETDAERDYRAVIGNMRVCAIATAIAAPVVAIAFTCSTSTMFFVCAFVCEFFLFMLTAPVNAVILRGVPTAMRASAMALSIFAIHVLGDMWSPPLVGLIADYVPIQWAMMLLPVAFSVAAATWWARKAPASKIDAVA